MMITGDYQHTAIAVARGVGMIAMDSQVVIVDTKSERAASASVPVAQHTAPLTKPGSALQHPGERTASISCQQLMFTLDRGGVCEEAEPHTAMTSIAQVGCAKNHHAVLPIHTLRMTTCAIQRPHRFFETCETKCAACISHACATCR